MRVLCVAEKPSISKSIAGILSGGRYTIHNTGSQFVKNYEFDYPQTNSSFIVTCVAGHLTAYDFTETHRKWSSCDPAELFDAPVVSKVAEDKKPIEQNLMTQARRVDTLMIWTDCDREGEHIGMEIVIVCKKVNRNIVVKRARFSAIIAQQIHRAAQHPVELDQAQADAVDVRFLLDLRIGAAFTRMQTMSLSAQFRILENHMISYGPCQFPTLGFVVQRYNQVKAFVPESFWYIFLSKAVNTPDGPKETAFTWRRGHLFDASVALALYSFVMENPMARVTKVIKKDTKKWKPLPLTTVELQKAGSRLLKMAPKKVLNIAEKLYQQGFLSYPRTETDQFDPEFDFMSLIHKQAADPTWGGFAQSLEQGGFNTPRKGKHDDKAHPPIHPTSYAGGLTGDEKRVYEYITRRFLACCSKDAEGWQTTVEVVCGGEFFNASGLVVLRRNYLEVYPYDKWSDHPLPEFDEGETFQPTACELREGQTSKPHLLTEADLVSLMDKNGIGTDATIAHHIQNIVDREYVVERMEGSTKYLVPSKLGIALVEGYDQIALERSVSKPQLRRETERWMVQVCERTTSKQAMLDQSLRQYKEMYWHVTGNWDAVVQSVRRYLEGGGRGGGEGGGGGARPGNAGGPGGGGPGNDDDNENGSGGGGRGGTGGSSSGSRGGQGVRRGGRGGSASAPTKGKGRRTGGTSVVPDIDMTTDHSSGPTTETSLRQTLQTSKNSGSSSTGTKSTTSWPSSGRSSSRSLPSGSSIASSSANISAPCSGVLCDCGLPALRKMNQSGVMSVGRAFDSCSRDTCGFWKWADDGDSTGPRATAAVPQKRNYSQTNDGPTNPARNCRCGVPGIVLRVQKEGANHGRKFWKCQNMRDVGDCAFFEWDDEPPRSLGGATGNNIPSGRTTSSNVPSGNCFICDQEGHWAGECPQNSSKRRRSFGTSNNNSIVTSTVCYKCGGMGHCASACPSLPLEELEPINSHGGGDTSAGKVCFRCGEEGHWTTACPEGGTGYGSKTRGRGRGLGRGRGASVRGRGRSSSVSKTPTKLKRGRGGGKKSSFAAADDY